MIESGVRRLRSNRAVTSELQADVVELDDEIEIRVDAPGVEEEDIQVRYLTEAVLIRMDRFRGPRDGFELTEAERSVGFDGRVPLPSELVVNADEASATLRVDGTLIVRLPKQRSTDDEPVVATVEDEEGPP